MLDSTELARRLCAVMDCGRLTGMQRELRAKAIVALGAVVRDAFNKSQDYESLLEAVVDGLRPNDTPPF